MPVDRILEAELAVEQKSDQGVEGPGGTGGSGSSVSALLPAGGGGPRARSVLSPAPIPSPHHDFTLPGAGSAPRHGLSHLRWAW